VGRNSPTETQSGERTGIPQTHRAPRWLRLGFWGCIVIAVAVVFRRVFALAYPPHSAPPQLIELDAVFASHEALTLAHILPALAFVTLAPFLYLRRFTGAEWPGRLPVSPGAGGGDHCICDERLFRWRMGGAIGGPSFQQSFSVLAGTGMAVAERARPEAALDDAGDCNPARHRHDSTCDGRIFCYKPAYSSGPQAVLRHRVLDRLLDQHSDCGALATLALRAISNQKNGAAAKRVIAKEQLNSRHGVTQSLSRCEPKCLSPILPPPPVLSDNSCVLPRRLCRCRDRRGRDHGETGPAPWRRFP
jgi:hypothetical protein